RVTGGRPDPPILLLDELLVGEAFRTTVTPFIPNLLVQAFGESFSEPIGDCLRHDGVVVIVLGLEPVAQFFKAEPAGYRKTTDVIAQPRFPGSNEVSKRTARLASFSVCL